MDLSALSERVVFILVEPQHPGNVGAAARAMKNMGLRRLTIVNPPAYDPERARWMAPGCDDFLADIRITATLEEALEGCHRVVASTARHRKQGQPVWTPSQLAEQIVQDDDVVAVLFGREDFGLSTEHAMKAESLLRIPTPEHASLNLAQAVLLVAHAIFTEAGRHGHIATGRTLGGSRGTKSTASARKTNSRDRRADLSILEPAVSDIVALLDQVGYTRKTSSEKVALTGRQALQRASLSRRHVEALRGMVSRVRWALNHPDADWTATKSRSPNQDLGAGAESD